MGVFAVRQEPFLFNNLLALMTCRPLSVFRQQKKSLLILNLGLESGLLARGRFSASGRNPVLIMNWLDRIVIREYRSEF